MAIDSLERTVIFEVLVILLKRKRKSWLCRRRLFLCKHEDIIAWETGGASSSAYESTPVWCIIAKDDVTKMYVENRIAEAHQAFGMTKRVWASPTMSSDFKLRFVLSNVWSVLMYECWTWKTIKIIEISYSNMCIFYCDLYLVESILYTLNDMTHTHMTKLLIQNGWLQIANS